VHCGALLAAAWFTFDSDEKLSAAETQLLLEQLLRLEAEHPVTHWCATDGSRARDEDDEVACARAAVVFDANSRSLAVLGGMMAASDGGFELGSN
jgi:hypothetical protein